MGILTYKQLLTDKNYEPENIDDYHYNASMNPKGKSSKYIREYIIPELQAKSRYYQLKYAMRVKIKESKAEAVKRVRKELNTSFTIKKKEYFSQEQIKINKRAEELYKDMMGIKTLETANYIDCYLQYRNIEKFLKKQKVLSRNAFDVLFLIYCHNHVYLKNLLLFTDKGKTALANNLLKLFNEGYIERTKTGVSYSYRATEKAHLLFSEMLKTLRDESVIIAKEFEKSKGKTRGQSWAKYNGKFIYRIKDIYEATDIHKFDKRTV